MQITPEQKEFIESIIKETPAYKKNEFLMQEFCDETIRRAYNLVTSPKERNSVKPYLKRVINSVMMEIIKNSVCEFNDNEDISISYDFSSKDNSDEKNSLTEDKINQIKEIIDKMDKNIFEFRYIKGLSNKEIGENLEISEYDVDRRLLLMLNRINKEVFAE